MYKLSVYTNFPLLPTKGYRIFFETLFNSNRIELTDINNPLSANMSISFNHTDENLEKIIQSKIPIKNRHLVLYECEQILPKMHRIDILKQYGNIYSASPLWAKGFNPIIFNYGFFLEASERPKHVSERKFLFGLVQRNKVSCIRGEKYSLRREIIIKAKKERLPIELRGPGWEKSSFILTLEHLRLFLFHKFKNKDSSLILLPRFVRTKNKFRSQPVLDKQEFLGNVKVALIIENATNYVSEKLFDAFRAGAVPIYIGPDLDLFGIPKNAVIVANHDADSFIDIMKNIDSFELEQIQCNGWNFLKSHGQNWSEKVVMEDLAKSILNAI